MFKNMMKALLETATSGPAIIIYIIIIISLIALLLVSFMILQNRSKREGLFAWLR